MHDWNLSICTKCGSILAYDDVSQKVRYQPAVIHICYWVDFFAIPSVIDELGSYLEQRNTKIPRIVQNLSNTSPDNSDGILGLLFEFSTVIIHLTHFYYHDRIAYVR